MGITSITNLNPLPSAKPIDRTVEPPAMERVERTTLIADATYTPRGVKATRGSDTSDEDDEDERDEQDGNLEDDGLQVVPRVKTVSEEPKRQISFVA